MQNPKVIEIILQGTIPAKKNSRSNTKTGMSFPSTRFANWLKYALITVRSQTKYRFMGMVSIELLIYYGDNTRVDNDNCLTSVLDMLVEALVIREDRWQVVAMQNVQAAFREKKPGAFIRITELPENFFGDEYKIYIEKRKRKSPK